MLLRFFLAVVLAAMLAACQTATQPDPDPDPDPDPIPTEALLEVMPADAQVGETVTVTYRRPTGAVDVTIGGFAATQLGTPEAGEAGTSVVDVVVPAGASGWTSVAVEGGGERVEIAANARTFFVGSVLSTLGTDLQAVQDALDGVPVGGAVRIPAGTYAGNEPVGGLVIDNRLLVGSGEGDTVVDGVTQVTVLARTINTAGIADLTLRADATTVSGGTVVSTSWAFDPIPVPVTTSLGRFLMWNATLTGNGAITDPVIDADTLEVTSYGVASGELMRDSSAVNTAFEFDGATVRLYDVYMYDSSAVGPWTIVDSDIWTQDRFNVYQEAGNVHIERSRIAQVGDPLLAFVGPYLEIEMDAFDGSIVDSELTTTGWLDFVADDGGNRVILRSTLRAEEALDLDCDYLCTLTVEDSLLHAGGTLDMQYVGDAGVARILGSTLESRANIRIRIDNGGLLAIENSTLTADSDIRLRIDDGGLLEIDGSTLTSTGSDVELRVSEGLVVVRNSTIEADTYVDIENDDAGDIRIFDSSITAGEYIDFYMDYYGTLLIEGSTLSAGTYLDIDPWSGGSSAIIIRDSTLTAIEYIEINDTDGGDVTIEDSTLTAYCEYIDVLRDPGSIYLVGATLTTVGTMPDGGACAFLGSLEVRVATESGMVSITGSTLDAAGDVLIEDYSGGSNTPPTLTTQVGSADMAIASSTLTADGSVRVGTAGALAVTNSTVTATGTVTLAAPLLGQISTTGSTISPAPSLITAF